MALVLPSGHTTFTILRALYSRRVDWGAAGGCELKNYSLLGLMRHIMFPCWCWRTSGTDLGDCQKCHCPDLSLLNCPDVQVVMTAIWLQLVMMYHSSFSLGPLLDAGGQVIQLSEDFFEVWPNFFCSWKSLSLLWGTTQHGQLCTVSCHTVSLLVWPWSLCNVCDAPYGHTHSAASTYATYVTG